MGCCSSKKETPKLSTQISPQASFDSQALLNLMHHYQLKDYQCLWFQTNVHHLKSSHFQPIQSSNLKFQPVQSSNLKFQSTQSSNHQVKNRKDSSLTNASIIFKTFEDYQLRGQLLFNEASQSKNMIVGVLCPSKLHHSLDDMSHDVLFVSQKILILCQQHLHPNENKKLNDELIQNQVEQVQPMEMRTKVQRMEMRTNASYDEEAKCLFFHFKIEKKMDLTIEVSMMPNRK